MRSPICKLNNLEFQFFKSVPDVMPYIKGNPRCYRTKVLEKRVMQVLSCMSQNLVSFNLRSIYDQNERATPP